MVSSKLTIQIEKDLLHFYFVNTFSKINLCLEIYMGVSLDGLALNKSPNNLERILM